MWPASAYIRSDVDAGAHVTRPNLMSEAIQFERLILYSTRFWILQLHENQSYLGRCVLILRRDSHGSLVDLRPLEWQHLRRQLSRYQKWMSTVFKPDRFNYAQLGNTYPQLHVHCVPRYKSPRTWGKRQIADKRWGDNWSPTPRSPLSMTEVYKLAEWLRDRA
jgi:diadenosine tetraphosphate (Ap4A) HIT family hydrolase